MSANTELPNGRIEIALTFSVNLDHFAGFGHEPDDWVKLVQRELTRNSHYKPEVTIQSVRGGWKSGKTVYDLICDAALSSALSTTAEG